jgi:hypothetical protein
MGSFDQRTLAELWELESSGMQDRRVRLAGDQFLSLFLDKLDGRSYIFRHGLDESAEGVSVGDAEYWMYDTPEEARIEFGNLLAEARARNAVVDTDDLEELGDPEVDGPVTTEVGEENEANT